MVGIKILLADDHKIIRDGLRSLIEKEKDMAVVAEAENGRDAIKLARQFAPDIVVMDINMPDLNGVDATKLILEESPEVRIIALSIHSSRRFVTRMLRAGAAGYLVKHCAYEELADAIRMVADHKSYLSSQILDTVINDYTANLASDEESASSTLSTREREILQLVAEGTSSEDIADRLCISVKTVSSHRRTIMQKLDLHSVADLTRFAINEGLVSLDY
jgi:DNA-binding NarL/FixJ family response regulator